MTLTIDPSEDRETIADRIGARVGRQHLRTSSARQSRLRSASRRRTRDWDLALTIDEDHPTAHCDQNTGTTEIVVTGRELPQPVTDLEGKTWDYLAQRGLGWHEDGHVLFTDHDDFRNRLSQIDAGQTGTAKQLWNALEDGAIEQGLAGSWRNAYDVLRVLRANMFADTEPGIQDMERGGYVFPVAHAVQSILLDKWMAEVYDISRDIEAKLLADDDEYHFATQDDRDLYVNEIQPLMDPIVADALSIEDAVDRNERIFEFIEEVLDLLPDADADGNSQMGRDTSDDGNGMPDDATEGHSGSASQDLDLEDIDPDDLQPADAADEPGEAQVELPDGVEGELADDVADQQREVSGASDELLDELEEMAESIMSGPDSLTVDRIQLPDEEWSANESTYQAARQAAAPLSTILDNRLQHERQSQRQYGQRRGRFTGRGGALTRARRGERDVKERENEPDEKDYHWVFVLDRSGSMGSIMSQAEEALGMLAIALEEVGVEVMVIEMYDNQARLAKSFGTEVEDAKPQLFHGETAGSTPLSSAVDLARERLKGEGEHCYLTVVTDGVPDNRDTFEEAIRHCSMPTMGVTLGTDDDLAGMDDYDRATALDPHGDLSMGLQRLVQEAMFQ